MVKNMIAKNRNISIDLLRILSMIMIVSLHYFGKGGMLNITNIRHTSNVFAWTCEALFIVAVNCYVLISSYFLVKSEFNLKKFFKLAFEVIFYALFIYLFFVVFRYKDFTFDSFIDNIFPVLTKQYWFITVYLAMYLLSPYLNILINNLSQENHKKLIIILVLIFSIWFSIMPFAENLDKTNGYSIVWFITIYLIGGYIRLYKNKEESTNYRYLFAYFFITFVVVFSKFILYYLFKKQILLKDYSFTYYNYNSITILLSSICLFLFFKSLNLNNICNIFKKTILIFSPLTFGVYLIHEHPFIREILYTKILHCQDFLYSRKYIFVAIISIFSVYIICSLIDFSRSLIFEFVIRKVKSLKKHNKQDIIKLGK